MKFSDELLKKLGQFGTVVNASLKAGQPCDDNNIIQLKNDGIRFEITHANWPTNQPKYYFRFFVRNENGGMELFDNDYRHMDESELIVKIGQLIKDNPPAPKTAKDHTPIVLKFVDSYEPGKKFIRGSAHWPQDKSGFKSIERVASARPQINKITNVHIVNLDGRLFDGDVFAPTKSNLMFHIECINSLGATFDILTNGEEFIPVDRYFKGKNGKMKTVKNTSPKASVDLTAMNRDDQEMVQYAIECFMTEQVSDEPQS